MYADQLGKHGVESPKLESVKQSTPMNEAFGELASQQERTDELVSQLQKRLDAALEPLVPSPATDKAEPYPESTCELHEQAMVAVRRQRRLNERLSELLGRVAI